MENYQGRILTRVIYVEGSLIIFSYSKLDLALSVDSFGRIIFEVEYNSSRNIVW
jgi:hypothetical protein